MIHQLYKALLAIFVCSCISNTSIAVQSDDFTNISYDNTVPFVPPVTYGKVIKVYDGDTITIAARLPYSKSAIYRIAVRLNGIDTPEIKGQTQKEKDLAKKIRDTLQTKLMNKIVQLKNTSSEKYGRLLADVYLDGVCINEWMVEQGYAVRYHGGTKIRPTEWIE
uniref:TNase-like domain-containing protein n=1 Tax=viral metagenome TaxID=1070528 RepID=A0A6C0HI73_9ZZZZ